MEPRIGTGAEEENEPLGVASGFAVLVEGVVVDGAVIIGLVTVSLFADVDDTAEETELVIAEEVPKERLAGAPVLLVPLIEPPLPEPVLLPLP